MFFLRCVSHPLPSPLSSCPGCIPPLIGLPLLRSLLKSVLCGCLLFVSSVCVFVCVFCFLLIHIYIYIYIFFPSSMATMSFAGYFLARSLLSAFPAFLRMYSRFDLVWFRLSCGQGWIRSGSVNVRKTTTTTQTRKVCFSGGVNGNPRLCIFIDPTSLVYSSVCCPMMWGARI